MMNRVGHQGYKIVRENESDADTEDIENFPTVARQRKAKLLVVKDIALVALALLGLASYIANLYLYQAGTVTSTSRGTTHTGASCYCGKTVAEARQRGCKYDSLCAAWLPDHCRDDELTAEFEQLGDGPNGTWLYWADAKHTIPLTVEEVAELGDDPEATFHMSGQWHVTHCFMFWRLEHRSRFNGKRIEGRSDTEKHIFHCQEVILHPHIGVVSGVTLDADNSFASE